MPRSEHKVFKKRKYIGKPKCVSNVENDSTPGPSTSDVTLPPKNVSSSRKKAKLQQTFCAVMNMPKPAGFRYYTETLRTAAKEVCVESMKKAVEEAVRENDGCRNIAAAFDGSWQKRGPTRQHVLEWCLYCN
ncbi:hypothetical protein J6590_008244 [Homalodisca vitripennis]|nr:hypothetical protein J6590_008244 [Homalodisca vitripennis]